MPRPIPIKPRTMRSRAVLSAVPRGPVQRNGNFDASRPGIENPRLAPDSPRQIDSQPRPRPLVLVVDDQTVQRMILREALESDGYRVIEAANGSDGLGLYERMRPDIVLLDVRMPGMDGFDVCTALRQLPGGRDVPILMVTVLGDQQSIDRAFDAGATDFITKPIVWSMLGARLRYMLKASEAFQKLARSEAVLTEEINARTRALDLANRKLALANEELEAYAISVSHDLRAPLRVVDGYVHLLLEAPGLTADDSNRDALHRIRAAVLRMNELIDDLLELSRVGSRELTRQDLDLTALAHEVFASLMPARADRRGSFLVHPRIRCSADSGLVRILLENLVSNAIKFSSRTTDPQIEIGIVDSGAGIEYFVRDNGAGFEPHHASRLFAPFQRLHTQDEFEGTGIGLAIVSRIVARHGGTVRAEAQLGAGATFYFTLCQ